MRVRRSSTEDPGIIRRRHGRGFAYRDARGRPITDDAILDRIASLAIPPAWDDVWICADERGHLQAAGLDADGRRQYRYHEAWTERAGRQKFARVRELANSTQPLRARITRDLAADDPATRSVAIAARLIDSLGVRVGLERYALERGTIGALTMTAEHVKVRGEVLRFDFPAKSGVQWTDRLEDAALATAVRSALRGLVESDDAADRRLTDWHDESGTRHLTPSTLGRYLSTSAGLPTTAKDLRTLIGSRTAAEALARRGPVARKEQDAVIRDAVVTVAERLRNTPAVARASYIDPLVLERYRRGRTARLGRDGLSDAAFAELVG